MVTGMVLREMRRRPTKVPPPPFGKVVETPVTSKPRMVPVEIAGRGLTTCETKRFHPLIQCLDPSSGKYHH